jgi:hypothetical protein
VSVYFARAGRVEWRPARDIVVGRLVVFGDERFHRVDRISIDHARRGRIELGARDIPRGHTKPLESTMRGIDPGAVLPVIAKEP